MFRNNFTMGNGAGPGEPGHPPPGAQGKMFIVIN